jgi:hypothetical protein
MTLSNIKGQQREPATCDVRIATRRASWFPFDRPSGSLPNEMSPPAGSTEGLGAEIHAVPLSSRRMDSRHGCRASHRSAQGSQRGEMRDRPPSRRSPRLRVKFLSSSWEWCICGCDTLGQVRAQIGDAHEKSAGLACGKCWQLCASGHECLLLSERNRSSASAARHQVPMAQTSLGVNGCGRVGQSESSRLIEKVRMCMGAR